MRSADSSNRRNRDEGARRAKQESRDGTPRAFVWKSLGMGLPSPFITMTQDRPPRTSSAVPINSETGATGKPAALPVRAFRSPEPWRHSYFCKLDDDLYVVRLPGESPRELFRLFTAADKLREPRDVGARQRLSGLIPVPLVGVDASNDDVVRSQRRLPPRRPLRRSSCRRCLRQSANDASGCDVPDGINNDRSHTRAFNDHAQGRSPISSCSAAPSQAEPPLVTRSGFLPVVTLSRTWTSSPRCLPMRAASNPIGPAPVTSTVRGSQNARCPTATTCSHAFVTTVVGSRRTPSRPSDGSTFIAYSGSIRQRSDINPLISFIPRSEYRPLLHMSHSPTAQFGQGTGSGRRTIPTIRSPSASPVAGPGSRTRPSDSCPSTRRSEPLGAQPYLPSTISTSVPQTPTAIASTRTDPSRAAGSGMFSTGRFPPGVALQ